MTPWIDFFVYAALFATVWFVLPAANRGPNLWPFGDRNPEWIAEHPETARVLARRRRRLILFCRGWGGVSLALLLLFQLEVWPAALPPEPASGWEPLRDLSSTLLLTGLACVCASLGISFLRVRRVVPIPERRRATLEPRSIDDLVPRWVRMAVYALAAINAAAWLTAGALQLGRTSEFPLKLALLLGASAVAYFLTRHAANRRPNAMDDLFGPSLRRGEVGFGLIVQLYFVAWGALHLLEQVAGPLALEMNRLTHLLNAGLVAFGVWVPLWVSWRRETVHDARSSPGPRTARE